MTLNISQYNKILQTTMITIFILLISACGFHLRGNIILPESFKTMFISSNIHNSQFQHELSAYLKEVGVNIEEQSSSNVTTIHLIEEKVTSTLGSVSSSTNTRVYRLNYLINFEFISNKGATILPPNNISVTKSLTVNANQVLGSTGQEQTMKQEMRRDLAQKIVAKITARNTLLNLN